ncbi:hypothetical protein GmHk_12G034775 [Glycine max]|nr:hypothetical protein GmHk_12G034775 [Glycine max]
MHCVTYTQDLVSPTLLAGWIELKEFYGLNGNHLVTLTISEPKAYPKWNSLYHQVSNSFTFKNVPSIMHSFMKVARFTHLNLEGTTKCRIVNNHHRKIVKIGNGWRSFALSENLLPRTQFIFEFSDVTSNFILFWLCL